jgi:hypothetical protein
MLLEHKPSSAAELRDRYAQMLKKHMAMSRGSFQKPLADYTPVI